MLWVRALAALIFAPLFLLAIQFFSEALVAVGGIKISWALFTLCLIVAFFGLWEYFAMAAKKHLSDRIVGIACGMILAVATMLGLINSTMWPLIIPAMGLISISAVVFNPMPLEEGIKRSAAIMFGAIYGGMFIGYLYLLAAQGGAMGKFWGQTALFAVWCCDTGAYFAGSTLGKSGKHKFAKNLSPKKSWEGFIGGILSAILLAVFTRWLYTPGYAIWQVIIIGAIAGIMGPIGDLAESLLKRSAGVKDAGKIIPGHGGILDRFDAVIFVAPIYYIVQQLFF